MTRLALLVGLLAAGSGAIAAPGDADIERDRIAQWRAQRAEELAGPSGWLSLVGLFWLEPGENTFGRAGSNRIRLDHPALADFAGSFFDEGPDRVRFVAHAGARIRADDESVSTVEMVPEGGGKPTVLESGSLRILLISHAGHLGVRIRDVDSPRRRAYVPVEYFPIDATWAVQARFEPYDPPRHLRIADILGLVEDKISPGAVIFRRDGHEWRLDTILQSPGDSRLFIAFTDGTTGKETYGGGRFLFVSPPQGSGPHTRSVLVDFNEAFNPPCAFVDFTVCPVPPYQNRLTLRIESGEKGYGNEPANSRH